MAYYRKRNGIWSYTIELPRGPNGERRQKYKGGFESRREAIKEATAIESEVFSGDYIPDNELTISELIDLWILVYKPTVKISSFATREIEINHVRNLTGTLKVQDFSKRYYQETINRIVKEKGIRFARRIHIVFNMLFKYAIRIDLLKSNPTEGCWLPKIEDKKTDISYLEKAELSLFLSIAKEYDLYYEVLRFLAYSGCRVGEAVALTWDDIDGNTVTINKTLYFLNGKHSGEHIQNPKTKASNRQIIIDDETLAIISKLKTKQLERRLQGLEPTNFIFTKPNGSIVKAARVNAFFKIILRRAGIDKKLTLHSLRHTHASILAAAGVPLEEVQKRLGHSNDEITRNIYYHVTAERKSAAMDMFVKYMQIQ
jgi:integrase